MGDQIERLAQPVVRTGKEGGFVPLVPSADGEYVRYDDHLRVLTEARAALSAPQEEGEGWKSPTVSDEVRQQIRETAEKLKIASETPAEEFSGHKGIYCANLEGFLGRYTLSLLNALEVAELAVTQQSEGEGKSSGVGKLAPGTPEAEAIERDIVDRLRRCPACKGRGVEGPEPDVGQACSECGGSGYRSLDVQRWIVDEADVPGSGGDYSYAILRVHSGGDPELGGPFPPNGAEVVLATELLRLRAILHRAAVFTAGGAAGQHWKAETFREMNQELRDALVATEPLTQQSVPEHSGEGERHLVLEVELPAMYTDLRQKIQAEIRRLRKEYADDGFGEQDRTGPGLVADNLQRILDSSQPQQQPKEEPRHVDCSNDHVGGCGPETVGCALQVPPPVEEPGQQQHGEVEEDAEPNWMIGPSEGGPRVLDGPAVDENVAVVPEHRLRAAEDALLQIAAGRYPNVAEGEVLSASSPSHRLWDRIKVAHAYFEGRTVWQHHVPTKGQEGRDA